ncbi:MAG TPA: carbonic anhydrase family protein [Gemmatimonadales bacterium]|nr:carbonic anhydrase family protein [Gemmatimonadales bacterium]
MRTLTFEKASVCLMALGFALVPARAQAQHATPHWSYSGHGGPAEWGGLDPSFAACSNGKVQSPINITGAKKADLPALTFDYTAVPLRLIDNGHTVQVSYAGGSTLTVGKDVYTLKQFHFHHPSEEHVNGQGFDLVAHLVHADAAGHLAVVAVLFTRGAPNPLLDVIWNNLPKEKEKVTDVPGVTVNVTEFLPADRGYYTFAGSLTTPPCSEGVRWIVLKTRATLSDAQLATFAKLYPGDARPIQPANAREILESR